MEKYLTSSKTDDNDNEKDKHTPMEINLEEESSTSMDVEKGFGNSSEKTEPPADVNDTKTHTNDITHANGTTCINDIVLHVNDTPHVNADNKNKFKKLKIKKNRGEKRKFPDKSDSKKIKRKKKEEKLTNQVESNYIEKNNEMSFISPASSQNKSTSKKERSTVIEIDSDVENTEKIIKKKSSRKSKTIKNKCKHTLEILSKFDSDVLESMDKSLKIIKSHDLLNNKYISIDVLLDLISLAMDRNKGENFEEASLSSIVSKCLSKALATPKRLKNKPNMAAEISPNNKSFAQEESFLTTPTSKEEVTEKETLVNQNLEETIEQVESNADPSEKGQEQTVEKSGKNFCITNYFKKLKKTVEERDKNERFSSFSTKTDMFLAPKLGGELTEEKRIKFEEELISQTCASSYLSEHCNKGRRCSKSVNCNQENKLNSVNVKNSGETDSNGKKRVSLIRVDRPKIEPIEAVCRTKAKLLQFHENRRPPYWGTWRRKSEAVRARRPFGKDKLLNYEVDSDDEWEDEEPGESLHGSDDEKEPEEDYEVDNDFFVPHGYLSDDEHSEKENMPIKTKLDMLEEQFTSEIKEKTRKMTPIVFGTFWAHKGLPPEGNLYQDLQIDKLQYVPWTAIPIEIEEEIKKTDNPSDQGEPTSQVKKPKQKIFPNEEIPNLIKMIHGSPQNSDHLARKFLLYWETERIPDGNRPGLTKVCVQKKIKELAAWQASHEKGKMCWQVPKETREEFGAQVENKTPEKKPRKCFIWKFVRKADKNSPGAGKPSITSPPPTASEVEPEVVILET